MSTAAAWLGAVTVLLATAGCGADQRVDRVERVDRSAQIAQECSHHVDALIDDRVVPRSDRDYATEMCLQTH
jgi:hypothetical protein